MSLSDSDLIYDSVTGCFNKKGCKLNLFQDLNFTLSFIFTIIDNFKARYKMDYYSLKEHNLTIIEQHSSLFILNSLLQNELLKISHNTLFPPSYLKKGWLFKQYKIIGYHLSCPRDGGTKRASQGRL